MYVWLEKSLLKVGYGNFHERCVPYLVCRGADVESEATLEARAKFGDHVHNVARRAPKIGLPYQLTRHSFFNHQGQLNDSKCRLQNPRPGGGVAPISKKTMMLTMSDPRKTRHQADLATNARAQMAIEVAQKSIRQSQRHPA